MVLGQIYGRSNFGHKFSQQSQLAEIMAKILDVINLAYYHKWSKPVYSRKLRHQHIKISVNLHKKEAQERCLKSEKVTSRQARCGSLGGLLIYFLDILSPPYTPPSKSLIIARTSVHVGLCTAQLSPMCIAVYLVCAPSILSCCAKVIYNQVEFGEKY